jgi:photosystem II stability/assembly factor-like uncharacterized protein
MRTLLTITLTLIFSFQLSAQWVLLSSNTDSHIRSVHFTDKYNGWIAGFNNYINKTSDGGETWENTGFHGSSSNRWYSIFAINSNEIYACGSTYNYDRWQTNYAFTVNGGNSWESQSSWGSAVGSTKQVFFLNENFGWKVGYSSPYGRLAKTMDGIDGWFSFYQSDHSLFSVYFIDQNTGWIACDEGFVLTSNDGGESWNEISTGITQTLRSIFFINSSIGWAVGHSDDVGVIIKTIDGGETWYQVNHPSLMSMYCIQFVNDSIGWACGSKVENSEERGVILYTNDGGENWTEQYVCEQLSALYSLFFIDEFTGWAVGYDGIIVKTTNAGGTSFEGVNEESSFICSLNIYPNPFATSATIEYELKQAEKVTLTVYNQMGKQVFHSQETQPFGKQQFKWNANGLPEGIYYYILHADAKVAVGKMVKVK